MCNDKVWGIESDKTNSYRGTISLITLITFVEIMHENA